MPTLPPYRSLQDGPRDHGQAEATEGRADVRPAANSEHGAT